ncbi:hypothetical protein [Jeotgalibacillus sp. R-1-5s-1]|uniref:hypothetical protein n=1 Tax=Jeotgalibacillus sp. R-1-5s-1 TaxID=2555897 RepID=UPI00106B7024|nr:hypothetical protein [Jeotgalibacillus sp. R-1-5s-1]TFD94431.1 hypothetical protein E2491_13425 [Jeotgalibacillus sp. R-1-5s-1]
MTMTKLIERIEAICISHFSSNLKKKVEGFLWLLKRKRFHQIYGVIKENEINAIAFTWQNEFHPQAEKISMFADETIGPETIKELIGKLIHHTPDTTADHFVCSVLSDESMIIDTLKENQFQLMRKTYMPNWEVSVLLEKLEALNTVTHGVYSLNKILKDEQHKLSFIKMLKSDYTQSHLVSPVAERSLEEWEALLLDGEPDLHNSLVYIENDVIRGYILLHPVSDRHYEIGWIGSFEKDIPMEVLRGIFKEQLIRLRDKGIQTVEAEVDSTDLLAYELFSFAHFKGEPSWDSYKLVF